MVQYCPQSYCVYTTLTHCGQKCVWMVLPVMLTVVVLVTCKHNVEQKQNML